MNMLARLGAVSAAIAIAAGAFAAHNALPPASDWLRTGSLYQLIHAVAVIALNRESPRPVIALLGGSTLFAVTLYGMAFGAPRWLGAVTPVGGVLMIGGWLWLALARAR